MTLADSASFQWSRRDVDGGMLLALSGRLNEHLESSLPLANAPSTVVIDLEQVTQISSTGILAWKQLLHSLRGREVLFVRASPAFVTQLNTVKDFAGTGRLWTFFAPYHCDTCGVEALHLVDVRQDGAWLGTSQPPKMSCPSCLKPLSFDDEPALYFSFARQQAVPNPSRVARALAEGVAYIAQPLRIEKEITQALTALWLSGSLTQVRILPRFLDGAEGEVLIGFRHVTDVSEETLAQLLKVLRSLPYELVLWNAPSGWVSKVGALWPSQVKVLSVDDENPTALLQAPTPAQQHYLSLPTTRSRLQPPDSGPSKLRGNVRLHDFGPFRVLATLNRTPWLDSFVAQRADAETAPPLVLKRVSDLFARDVGYSERLLSELERAQSLQHPNVAPLREVGRLGTQVYFTHDYVEGMTLYQALNLARKKRKTFNVLQASWLLREMALALQAAHQHHTEEGVPSPILHLGMSPHSVFLTESGKLQVEDFGFIHAAEQAQWTPSQTLFGHRMYLAPEQIRMGILQFDKRVDLFPLGLMFFECLTLKHMFARETEYASMWAVLNEPVKSFAEAGLKVPPLAEKVLARCLNPQPQNRYSSMAELLVDLEALGTADNLEGFWRELAPTA